MATIENLDIQISASSISAEAAIDKLVASVTNLEKALSGISGSKFASQMKNIENSAKKAAESMSNMSKSAESAGKGTQAMTSSMRAAPSILNAFTSSTTKSVKSMRSLASVFGSLYANFFWLRRAFRAGLGAIEISSDLTEVQNVVDVTFGDMEYKLDDFAKTSRQAFGLSELSAKKYASQFQAMFTAMGMSNRNVETINERMRESGVAAYSASKGYTEYAENISDLSLNLTKLAADMGSFFNQQPEDVAKRLQAGVISGQSRALRQYGVDLTMATLQQWALDNGINATVQSMTQAEKTMLRYQYVMSQMQMSMGDFTRTANTWANQVKLLKQNFQALGAVIGTALIGWIKPVVQAINSAMNTIIELVQRAVNAIGKLMGWQVEIGKVSADSGFADDLGGIADSLDDASGGAGGTAKGLEDATDAAKKLKHQLMGYDELNLITTKQDEADGGSGGGSGGGGGGGGAGGGGGGGGGVSGGEALFRRYMSDIDNWWELGRRISETLTKAMERIDWEKIYRKAERFGTGLADFLNGLITPNLFSAIGRTVAGALNTALHFLDSFGERFDWKKFGFSLAAGLNRFFQEFDFELLARTINVFVHGILDTIIEFIDKTNWDKIGQRIGKFLVDIDFIGIGKKVGTAIWKAINAGFRVASNMFEIAPLETALLGLVGVANLIRFDGFKKFAKVFGTIGAAFNTFIRVAKSGEGVLGGLALGFPKLWNAIKPIAAGVVTFTSNMKNGVGVLMSLKTGFGAVAMNMSPFAKALGGVITGLLEFMKFKNVFQDIGKGTASFKEEILGLAGAFASAGIAFTAIFGFPTGLIAASIVALIGAFKGLRDGINEQVDTSAWNSVGTALAAPNGTPIEDISNHYTEMFNKIEDGFSQVSKAADGLDSVRTNVEDTSDKIDLIAFAMEHGALITESKCAEIKQLFNDLLGESQTIFDQEYDVIVAGIAGSLGDAAEAAGLSVDSILGSMNKLKSDHDKAVEEIKKSQADLDKSFEENAISQEEYYKKTVENARKLRDVNGDVDAYSSSVDGLNKVVKDVDFSGLVTSFDGVYSLDMSGLSAQLTQVGNAYEDASKSVSEASGEMQKSFADYASYAQSIGDTENASLFRKLADMETKSASDAQTELQKGLDEYSNTIMQGLQNKMPSVIDQALSDYENLSWMAKLTTKETDYVSTALGKYQSEVIDKAAGELEKMYNQLGLDSSEISKKAGEDIISKFFETTSESSYEGVTLTETKLKDDWRTILNNVGEDAASSAEEAASNVVAGWNNGIENNSSTSEAPVKSWSQSIADWFTGFFQERSPSKLSEEWGRNVVLGFNNGISKSSSVSASAITSWASNVGRNFLAQLSTIGNNMLATIQTNFGNAFNTVKSRVDAIRSAAHSGFEGVKSTVSSAFSSISSTISQKMNSARDVVKSGVGAIQSAFNNMKLKFPDIKMPHFSMGTQSASFLGQSITLPKIDVQWYAQGGFPEDGLFFANHHELVGTFSNGQTAVANNQQIVQGIQQGVYYAVRDAMNDSGGMKVEVEANANGMFKVMQKKSRQFKRSTNVSAFG